MDLRVFNFYSGLKDSWYYDWLRHIKLLLVHFAGIISTFKSVLTSSINWYFVKMLSHWALLKRDCFTLFWSTPWLWSNEGAIEMLQPTSQISAKKQVVWEQISAAGTVQSEDKRYRNRRIRTSKFSITHTQYRQVGTPPSYQFIKYSRDHLEKLTTKW